MVVGKERSAEKPDRTVMGPLDQARIRSLASLLIGPINPGRQIFRKTTTGSRVGLRRVRPELLGFPGSSQPVELSKIRRLDWHRDKTMPSWISRRLLRLPVSPPVGVMTSTAPSAASSSTASGLAWHTLSNCSGVSRRSQGSNSGAGSSSAGWAEEGGGARAMGWACLVDEI